MRQPFFPSTQHPTRTAADVALRRLLGLLIALLLLAACIRKPYHARRTPPSWAERERTQEFERPRH